MVAATNLKITNIAISHQLFALRMYFKLCFLRFGVFFYFYTTFNSNWPQICFSSDIYLSVTQWCGVHKKT